MSFGALEMLTSAPAGETLAMKGLTLNCMDKKKEAVSSPSCRSLPQTCTHIAENAADFGSEEQCTKSHGPFTMHAAPVGYSDAEIALPVRAC